ncbi:hypothetical protein SDC9_187072 [bioreactor metagenome]|uniref:Uncharacterized protein n=1 Tax=bioreactor metagenome TaxID=1076179 RepID=A0A645HTR5_9ZZZZ
MYRQGIAGIDARHFFRLLAVCDAGLVFLHHLYGRFVVGADPFLDITSNNDAIFVGNKNAAADNLARTFGDILGHLLKHRKTTPGLFYSRA